LAVYAAKSEKAVFYTAAFIIKAVYFLIIYSAIKKQGSFDTKTANTRQKKEALCGNIPRVA
jgi:hypothetical protein